MTKQADKVSWFEMPADDVARASEFYNKVFGWATPPMGSNATFAITVKANEHGNPTEVGGINGGIHKRMGASDAGPVINIHVDDIDAKLKAVETAGGRIIQPRTEIAEYGIAWHSLATLRAMLWVFTITARLSNANCYSQGYG
ncbi:MAG TPA: VOC family protein [Candidatus Saccharimonadales bacterium]